MHASDIRVFFIVSVHSADNYAIFMSCTAKLHVVIKYIQEPLSIFVFFLFKLISVVFCVLIKLWSNTYSITITIM